MRLRIPHSLFLLGPTLAFAVGFTLNAIVIAANGGSMPVLVPAGANLLDPQDWIHHAMTAVSHLPWLSDWIVIRGFAIASPGDFLIWAGLATQTIGWVIWAVLMIRDANERR